MHAIRLHGTHDLRLDDIAEPLPGPGELQIRVEAAGICGTDRHLTRGEFPCTPPVTLGHEFCGIVTAVGAGVTIPLGTRVTCDPNHACGTCRDCRAGRVNLCTAPEISGITRDGGFQAITTFPAARAIPLPATLSPLYGALAEPLACTLHGLDLAALRVGERAVVLGGGVIGLMALQLARLAGAETLVLTRTAAKRDIALALGATHVAASVEAARKIWPDGAECVIECAGVVETVEVAPTLTSRGGRVVLLGVLPQGTRTRIDPFDLLFREVRLIPSFLNPFTQTRAARLIADGRIDVAPLITRTLPLAEGVGAILGAPLSGDVRVLLLPD